MRPFRAEPAGERSVEPKVGPRVARDQLAWGALAGALGTVAMTMVMEGYYAFLPPNERQQLEPSQIVRQLERALGVEGSAGDGWGERAHTLVTLVSHVGYGAVGGMGYVCTMRGTPAPTLARGALFGAGVFAMSYLGWLPSLGVLRSATTFARGRSVGLLVSHLVYGCVTAAVVEARL